MRRLLVALPLVAAAACAEAGLQPSDAWIREAPPGAGAMAGYLTLHNRGGADIRCDAVRGADFDAAELHRSVIENGMSRMLRGQVLLVPAGGAARLAPGGLHIMLFGPLRELRAGDRTRLRLQCGGQEVEAEFVVRKTE